MKPGIVFAALCCLALCLAGCSAQPGGDQSSAATPSLDSAQLLEDLAGTGDWLEGMRFQSSVSESDVQAWLDGLNLEF